MQPCPPFLRKLLAWVNAALAVALLSSSAEAQTILRVNGAAPAGGDGSTWPLAFQGLQAAITAAEPIAQDGLAVQIWVAAGVYKPTTQYKPPHVDYPGGVQTVAPEAYNTGPRTETFRMRNNIALYGGFVGNETVLSARDFLANETVLSGDLGSNDGPGPFEDDTENAYHVVTSTAVNSTARLDGFTITGARADEELTTFDRSVLRFGGGMLNAGNASPMVVNCTFIANRNMTSTVGGGAMMNYQWSSPVVVNCQFLGNQAANAGGAVWNFVGSAPLFVGCTFSGNRAGPVVGCCTIPTGGAVVDSPACPPGYPCGPAASTRYVSCTFVNNTSTGYSGGLFTFGPGQTLLDNCIFWQNTAELPSNNSWHFGWIGIATWYQVGVGVTPQPHNSCIQAGLPAIYRNNTFDSDPVFINALGVDGIAGTRDDDLRLSAGSPCIDSGSRLYLANDAADLDGDLNLAESIPFDLAYGPRVSEDPASSNGGGGPSPPVDIGAFEHVQSAMLTTWMQPGAGAFQSAVNWSAGVPTAAHWAVLGGLHGEYTVSLGSNADIARLSVIDATTRLNLGGNQLTLLEGAGAGFNIDGCAAAAAQVTLQNGTLTTPGVTIGRSYTPKFSDLLLGGPSVLLNSLTATTVHGQLTLTNGAAVASPLVQVGADGVLEGNGTITGAVINNGEVFPGLLGATGVLEIVGRYTQLSATSTDGSSGTLSAEVGGVVPGSQHDQLVVSGDVQLGGGLVVRLINGFSPSSTGLDIQLISAGGATTGTFDVAFLPALPMTPQGEQPYLRVNYGQEDGGVSLGLGFLGGSIGFGGQVGANTEGIPTAAAVGELDGINGPDLAIAVPSVQQGMPGSLFVFYNAGTNGLGEWQGFLPTTLQLTVGIDPSAIAIGNLDLQNRNDIAVANAGSDTVSILINNGSGVFSALAPVTVGDQPTDVAIGDITTPSASSFPDLLVANAASETATTFTSNENPGSLQFLTGTTLNSPRITRGKIIDIDNDKDLDIVILTDDAALPMHTNNGSGSFTGAGTLIAGSGATELSVGDLNGDSRPDLVTTNGGSDSVSVLLNTTAGAAVSFAPSVDLPAGDEPRSITVFDMEGDGDNDLAVIVNAEGGERQVQVLRNDLDEDSNLLIVLSDTLTSGSRPLFVLSDDVDVDGRREVITVNEGGELIDNGVVVLPNTSTAPPPPCGSPDFDGDGDQGTDLDIEAFFACLGGDCCATCGSPDFDQDGDQGTDLDIEAFFRVLGGGSC